MEFDTKDAFVLLMVATACDFFVSVSYINVLKITCAAGTPFGQMPVLETERVKISQSKAIARFLARKFGKLTATRRILAWLSIQHTVYVYAF